MLIWDTLLLHDCPYTCIPQNNASVDTILSIPNDWEENKNNMKPVSFLNNVFKQKHKPYTPLQKGWSWKQSEIKNLFNSCPRYHTSFLYARSLVNCQCFI